MLWVLSVAGEVAAAGLELEALRKLIIWFVIAKVGPAKKGN
jgi:hypothetical protein